MTIAWICDMPGWAYEQRALRLARLMPGYVHRLVYYWQNKTPEEMQRAVAKADIVCCLCHRYAGLLAGTEKTVCCLGGSRLL